MMKSILYLTAAMCLTSCSSPTESLIKSLDRYFEDDTWQTFSFRKIDLKNWTKLCIIEPYSTIEMQSKLIGVESPHIAPITDKSVTLAFINSQEVVGHILHRRIKGDFIKESDKCFEVNDSVFVKQQDSASDWMYIVHFNE